MTTKLLLAAIIAFCTITTVSAKAKIPFCIPCERIQMIKELPTDSEIQKLAGQKVNLSYLNSEYGILWMSVWNTDGRYVLSDISNNMYFEIDTQEAQILREKHNFDVATTEHHLSFWKKAGGKLVLSFIIAFLIWGSIPSKNKPKTVKPTNI